MSTLEFFDVFRMFLGELENRGYNNNQRQFALSQAVAALKDVLVQVEAETQPDYPQYPPQQPAYDAPPSGYTSPRGYQQQYQPPPQQYQPPPQQYQPPPQQYQPPPQQQYQPPPQQQYQPPPQQQYQPPPQQPTPHGPSPSPANRGPPPPVEEPEPAGPTGDGAALASISTVVYGTGIKLQQVWKQINVDGDGVTNNQLVDGLQKLGVRVPPATIIRLAAPYYTGPKMVFSGFIRMLAAGQEVK